jgi:predicted aspartyl protease
MTGVVDAAGRTLLRIHVRQPDTHNDTELDAWVDTGFTGELVVPEKLVFHADYVTNSLTLD